MIICLFYDLNSPFQWLNSFEAVMSSSLIVQLKLKCSKKKPTHDEIIKAKEVYIQLSFEIYKGKLLRRF